MRLLGNRLAQTEMTMHAIRTISHLGPRLRLMWLAVVAAPSLASAQGDVFASNGGGPGRPFSNVPAAHPDCAGLVHEYWAMTDELDALFEQRKQSVNPEATEIGKQINEKAKERGEVGDQILECVKNDVIGSRPLQGQVDQTDLRGGVDELAPFELHAEQGDQQPGEEIVLRPGTPQLDTRQPTGGSGGTGSRTTTDLGGKLTPGSPGAKPGGEGGTSSQSTTRLGGKLTPGSSGGGDSGGAGGVETRVETSVSGKIVGSGNGGSPGGNGGAAGGNGSGGNSGNNGNPPRGSGPGGTVPNDFTRNYFFAQGMLKGVDDAGQQLGGRLGQIMIATQYVVRGDYKRAQQWLGLQPGQSITVADLQKDLEQFSEVINGDPDGTDLRHSYESGRTVGKKLVEIVSGKYLNVPPLQPPLPGTPGAPNAAAPPAR
jgi:hypothetical protein